MSCKLAQCMCIQTLFLITLMTFMDILMLPVKTTSMSAIAFVVALHLFFQKYACSCL